MQLVRGDHIFPAAPGVSAILPQGRGEATLESSLPANSVARIWKPAKSATTSGRARSKDWRLRIERESAPSIEPLMGWTAGEDTAHQVELAFPSLEAAIRRAERLGIAYEVHLPPGEAEAASRRRRQNATAMPMPRGCDAFPTRRSIGWDLRSIVTPIAGRWNRQLTRPGKALTRRRWRKTPACRWRRAARS